MCIPAVGGDLEVRPGYNGYNAEALYQQHLCGSSVAWDLEWRLDWRGIVCRGMQIWSALLTS